MHALLFSCCFSPVWGPNLHLAPSAPAGYMVMLCLVLTKDLAPAVLGTLLLGSTPTHDLQHPKYKAKRADHLSHRWLLNRHM